MASWSKTSTATAAMSPVFSRLEARCGRSRRTWLYACGARRPTDASKRLKPRVILSAWPKSAILRWDANTYEPIDILAGHKKMVHCMIPVDNYIWSCSSDNLICVWDPNTGKLVSKIIDHKSRVFYMLRVNNQVWSCAWDKTIKIHAIDTLSLVKEIEPVHRDALSCLITIRKSPISPLQVWSGSWDHTVIIWKTSDPDTHASTQLLGPSSISSSSTSSSSSSSASTSGKKHGHKAYEPHPHLLGNNKRTSTRLSMFFGTRDPVPSNMQSMALQASTSSPNLNMTNAHNQLPSPLITPPAMTPANSQYNLSSLYTINPAPPPALPTVSVTHLPTPPNKIVTSPTSSTPSSISSAGGRDGLVISPPPTLGQSSSTTNTKPHSPRSIFNAILSPRSQSAMSLTSPRKDKEKDKDKDKDRISTTPGGDNLSTTPGGDNLSPKCISQPSPSISPMNLTSPSLSHALSHNELIPPHIQHQHIQLPPPPPPLQQYNNSQLTKRITLAHDLTKQSINHAVTCGICNGKISTNWGGKKQVFHCNNCKEYYHNGECVEQSLSNNCSSPKS
ncbi:hypothetical protein DFA_11283 [Cavenderia fasciculata]|uniref:WD40 repeat-containing protein n=1 Tax=Cavenderia fasciculata TaxID=261658 RepID=F4QC35_CACFS|nr:uncharacterized protein DFA_11283 [Cavenderia fasciculata]EGG13522.1 hypothetical protein DFA_11283 [Cavenderia fasciculata]|eukprot:XP_004350226.1 hypothetical protein DFA_11283 [Cavenderia fasciculata]